MSDFTGVFGDNQGIAASLQTDQTNDDAADPAAQQSDAAGAAGGDAAGGPASITTRGNAFDPDIQLPYTQSWSAGWQRKVSRDSAIELRYVGSKHENDWDSINLNEPNITSNGFLNEFRQAQANLQANIAAGRGATFAYMGAGSGTSPLPILLAHFNAQNAANAGNQALYTGAQLDQRDVPRLPRRAQPESVGLCDGGRQRFDRQRRRCRNNAVTAGLPVNFFVANPDLLGAGTTAGASNLTVNSGGTRAHSVQFEYRKRFSNGFSINTSYTFSLAELQQRYGFTKPIEWIDQAGQVGNVRHALKANWSRRSSGRQGSQVRRRHERLPRRDRRRLVGGRRRPHPDR